MQDGCESKKNSAAGVEVSNKSERSQIDSQAPMGNAATRSLERVAAAMGALESAPIEFQATCDVVTGGADECTPYPRISSPLRLRQWSAECCRRCQPCWRRDCCTARLSSINCPTDFTASI